MKFGVALGALNPHFFLDATLEAEKLGYESVWLPEHLVFPTEMGGSPFPGDDHPPVPPSTPVFDAFAYLSYLAGRTSEIRLGTNIYLLGLRHPFVAARAVQTFDIVSGGRAEIGIGAGWLREEWTAAGLDPRTRGRRLDEALAICKRLWTEEVVTHDGDFYAFDSVMFEPKPVQRPYPPIHVGGESEAALQRAARSCNGWLGLHHTLESVAQPIRRLRELLSEFGRSEERFEIIVGATLEDRDDVNRWEDAGVTRIVTSPWRRSPEAVEGLRRYAEQLFG
ncbi:MAG: LLM class F420-dependent oxidoreductase [Myxococcota bacterium]